MVGMNSLVWEAFCRVNVYWVPDFYVIIFQNLLSSIYWNRVLSGGSLVVRSYFGQVVSPVISFQTYVSFDPVEGDRSRLSYFDCFPPGGNG